MKKTNRRRKQRERKRRAVRLESLEHRLCLAVSVGWDGPGLGAASLSYYVGDVPADVGLEQAEVETAIETALDAWAQVADLTFTQTTLARQSDSLDITFTSIDGSGGILAQAYLPDDVNRGRLAGDIEFDLADPWETGNDAGRAAFDLVYVAVHEIGHALGLDHLNIVGSVMRPNVSPSQVFTTLATADVNEILGVYATATSEPPDTGGNTDVGVPDSADQGGDTTDDGSSSDDNTSGDNERPRWRRGEGRGRFGRWRGQNDRATPATLTAAPSHHNSEIPADVNADGSVTALDALTIINDLNKKGPRRLSFGEGEAGSSFSMVDVDGDESITAIDALRVINQLNSATAVPIASIEPVDAETIEDEDASTDDAGSTEETETAAESDPIDDASAGMDDTDAGSDTEAEEEVDDAGTQGDEREEESEKEVADDDETDFESDDHEEEQSDSEADEETPVDNGPLEEEHEACRGGSQGLFARLDTNEDGLLTMDEVPEMLWEKLLAADADEDGAVSPAELEAIAHEHHRRDPFARFDTNEDGALTVDEVPERLWERLSQADADEDGAVTADELAEIRTPAGEGESRHRRRLGDRHRHR